MTFSKKNHSTPLHSTELFKIFFSLLTLSTAFLQKASGPGKNKVHHVNKLMEPDPMMCIREVQKTFFFSNNYEYVLKS